MKELKDCKSYEDIADLVKESTDEQVYQLWKSGKLRAKSEELKLINQVSDLDNMNINTSKGNIIARLREIYPPGCLNGCGCVVLLFIISFPLNIAVGYALISSFIA